MLIILPFLIFIYETAQIDAVHILRNEKINHGIRLIQRLSVVSCVFVVDYQAGVAIGLLFVATFDQTLNHLCGLPFWYLGTTSRWDIFWKKHLKSYKIMKVLTLIISLILFTITL